MGWGPRKLKRILERTSPDGHACGQHDGEIVKRAGLVAPRKKRRRTEPYTQRWHTPGVQPGVVRDFKGWFKAGDVRASIR